MKQRILLLFISLTALSAFSHNVPFMERHKMAVVLDSITRKENIRQVTEDAKERLLSVGEGYTRGSNYDVNEASPIIKKEDKGIFVEGEWKFRTYGYYFERIMEEEYYGMLVGSTLLLECYNKDLYPIIGEYDDATQTFTISKRYVGRDWRGRYHFIYPYVPVGNGGVKPGEIQATFNSETGELLFPEGVMLAWLDYEDPEGTKDEYDEMEWHTVFSAKRIGDLEKERPENWISKGYATLIDGWVSPRFGMEQTNPENWLHPELLQYKNNPNIYRLKNPFDEGLLGEYNQCRRNGYIEFDVTDPAHVIFNRIDCGWVSQEAKVSKMYCYNLLGYFMEDYKATGEKYTLDEFLMFFDPDIAFTTYKDGVVELGIMLYGGELLYDANFGDANYPAGGNVWVGMDMRTKIYFPEIEPKEPSIEFTSEPVVKINSTEKKAEIKLEFEYENKPENATIFAMVTDENTGENVARKYVNQKYYYNDYSFSLDNIEPNANYNYSVVIRLEGGCSEVIYTSKKKVLDFTAARQGIDQSGVDALYAGKEDAVYFNLQGMKVDNPQKGEIYIVKRGDKTFKVIY